MTGELVLPVLRLSGVLGLLDRDGERLHKVLGPWILVGQPIDESRKEEESWSFRTRSLNPSIVSSPGGTPFMVHLDDVVLPLRKSRAGPFSGLILIGRSSSNDVQIAHRSVSKLHARFEAAAGDPPGPTIEDAGSSNGTTVDEVKIAAGERRPLSSGCVVGFGTCSFQLLSTPDLASLLRQFRP